MGWGKVKGGREVGKAKKKRRRGGVGRLELVFQVGGRLCALPSGPGVSTCRKAREVNLGGTL